MVGVGHTMKKMRTILEVQGYAPDWPALEEHFPEIKRMLDYPEKWAYIEQRCQESEEDAEFVRQHRPKMGNSQEIIKDKVVTDDFCEDIVAALVAETWTPLYKYHHWGTGTNAENATDSALQTPGAEARAVGTHIEGATAKTYKSVGTLTCNATPKTIVEHGLFKASSIGVLMDRTKHGAHELVEGNQIEYTFNIAFTSGS